MSASFTSGRSISIASPTVISGRNTASGGSINCPIVPSGYTVLRFHCAATSAGAEAAMKSRAEASISARIFWTIAGLICRKASTTCPGGTRSITAAASAGGSERIWDASGDCRGTVSTADSFTTRSVEGGCADCTGYILTGPAVARGWR
jgi:hypothetical protein